MSSLDLIRALRRALASLRDAHDPGAVNQIARALAYELELELGQLPSVELPRSLDASALNAGVADANHAPNARFALTA